MSTFISLAELQAKYSPVYPEPYTWDATLAHILKDPDETVILNELMKVIISGEQLRRPVLLGTAEFDDDIEIDAVLDGTHRVCAHMLAKVDQVYVEFEADRVVDESYDSKPALKTVLKFDHVLNDEDWDAVYGALRSFPLNKDLWVTSDAFGSAGEYIEAMWDIEEFNGDLIVELNAEVNRRIKHLHGENMPSIITEIYNLDFDFPTS